MSLPFAFRIDGLGLCCYCSSSWMARWFIPFILENHICSLSRNVTGREICLPTSIADHLALWQVSLGTAGALWEWGRLGQTIKGNLFLGRKHNARGYWTYKYAEQAPQLSSWVLFQFLFSKLIIPVHGKSSLSRGGRRLWVIEKGFVF